MKKLLSAALFTLLAAAQPAGAGSSDTTVLIVNGRGTLTLNSSAAVSVREYFLNECPLVLAAHESGSWVTATTGPHETCDTEAIDARRYIYSTLANCEGGERYGECWIVAIGRESVWDGKIRMRKGRWTPKTKRQHSVILAGESPNSTSGVSPWRAVGIATYDRKGETARLTFKRTAEFGRCRGTLDRAEGQKQAFTVKCSRAGMIKGIVALNADGRSGRGAGAGTKARHFDLIVLPHHDADPKKDQMAAMRPSS